MSNPVLDLNPKLAERSKAADNAALNEFHAKVLDLAVTFSIKEVARLLRISTGGLRIHAEKHGVVFFNRDERTPAQKRHAKKLWDQYMLHYEPRQVQAVVKPRPVQPGDLKITAAHQLEGRKSSLQRQNAFHERACKLAEVFTIPEAAEILGVSHRFLKSFAYNEQVPFVGAPSLDVKNDFHAQAVELAASGTLLDAAAKEMKVTPRFLSGYAMHWEITFQLPEGQVAAAACQETDDTQFMADVYLDEEDDDDAVAAPKAAVKAAVKPATKAAPKVAKKPAAKASSKAANKVLPATSPAEVVVEAIATPAAVGSDSTPAPVAPSVTMQAVQIRVPIAFNANVVPIRRVSADAPKPTQNTASETVAANVIQMFERRTDVKPPQPVFDRRTPSAAVIQLFSTVSARANPLPEIGCELPSSQIKVFDPGIPSRRTAPKATSHLSHGSPPPKYGPNVDYDGLAARRTPYIDYDDEGPPIDRLLYERPAPAYGGSHGRY